MKQSFILFSLIFGLMSLNGCGTSTGNPATNQGSGELRTPPDSVGSCDPEPFVCEDGTRVYRNQSNNCEFDPCP